MTDMQITRSTMLDEGEIVAFAAQLKGVLIRPGHPEYNEARGVWNGMIDRYPAMIARCVGVADVVTAVNFARAHKMLVAVRGGGHNVAGSGTCDGGLVIDLSPMRNVYVNVEARTARVEGGATLADIDAVTQLYGLAVPTGVVSQTGIGGLTLGGGLGWLRRKHGLTIDNLLSVDIVTADGRLLRASERENPELFWGVRGGGGNFGVVTAFEFRLHPVGPEVMFCFVMHPLAQAREGLRFFREYAASAPDEVSAFAILGTVPHAPAFPTEAQGQGYLAFMAMYAGELEQGGRLLQPLRDFTTPLADMSGVMPFVEVQRALDEDYPARTRRYYWKSAYVRGLDDATIDTLLEHNAHVQSHHSTIDIWQLGGAMSRIPAEATAFGSRKAPFLIGVEANWDEAVDDEANIDWVREYIAALQPHSDGKQYLNFPGLYEEGEAMMRGTFGTNYARLVELKRKVDPHNLFRLNQNIRP
jgi:FAD/FMN-containing dehydrogenase